MPKEVEAHAPAKVNLRLRVLAREVSGFHSLETVFCAVSLADTVTVRRGAPGIRLRVNGGVEIGPPERNLVARAADAFFRALGAAPAVELYLRKRIPAAAGLGGGSSDAAAALRALNALHDAPFGRAELLRIGAALGSDVPFFLCGSPLALGWGRGERLLALSALPARPLAIAHPGVPIPTPDAFRRLAERRSGAGAPEAWVVDAAALAGWEGIAEIAANDFAEVAADMVPGIGAALELFRESGARVALLSGSGAATFAVFDSDAARDRAAERVAATGWMVWRGSTLAREAPLRVDPPPSPA